MKNAEIMLVKLEKEGMNFEMLYALILNVVRKTLCKVGYAAEKDLAQDIFIKVIEKLGDYNTQKGSIKAWVATIAKNATIDETRRLQRKIKKYVVIDDYSYFVDEENDYEAKEEMFELLEREMQHLSSHEQMLLTQKYQAGKSGREIAKEFGINEKHVPMHVKRAKEKLRTRIDFGMAA